MIRQDQRTTGRSNAGRQAPATQRNYNRSANLDLVGMVKDFFGGGGGQPEMQTTTQQNLPSWAIPDAMSTLAMGNYYTQTPDYRASTLDRDYSGIRGGASGVGQFGLNPRRPALPGTNLDGTDQYRPDDINNLVARLPSDLQTPLNFGRGTGRYAAPTTGPAATPGGDFNNTAPGGASSGQTSSENQTFNIWDYYDELSGKNKNTYPGGGSLSQEAIDTINNEVQGVGSGLSFDSSDSFVWGGEGTPKTESTTTSSENQGSNTNTQTNTTTTTQPTIDPRDIFNPDNLTPFQAYDRQRFAAPSQNTVRGEGILAGRYNQRFGPGGTDPFAAANQAVGTVANYTSGFQGTTGEGQIGGQAGNYQANLANASNPGVFQSGDYTAGLPNYANPNANQTNVNAAMGNVNAGLQANTFSNANAGLTGPKNYNQNFQNLVNQSMSPYQDQVVNQTISDLDRARRMTQNEIGGQAAKAGAFGGSRQALLEAENNRNFADRTAAAVGQLRQQGFESAANRASQENLQRLGLTAQDLQQTRGLQSQGNLAAQGLTARDAQDVRGLQSQGALAAQGLQSQGGLAAQGLQSQGALAALNANAGLYQSALGLNAAGDRSAMGYNAGLLSDAMGLDAADLQQRRNIASTEAQFAETANRGAGALNLQGGTALGQLAQAGTADERQRIADMLASGQAQTGRNQQDLDFIFNEFNRELDYPGRQIDLRNAAISPATGSIVTTSQPRYQQNPILGGLGAAMGTYGMTSNPYLAGAAGILSLLG